jgi:hypothetical protein
VGWRGLTPFLGGDAGGAVCWGGEDRDGFIGDVGVGGEGSGSKQTSALEVGGEEGRRGGGGGGGVSGRKDDKIGRGSGRGREGWFV